MSHCVRMFYAPFNLPNGSNDERSSDCVWKNSVMQFSGSGSYETHREKIIVSRLVEQPDSTQCATLSSAPPPTPSVIISSHPSSFLIFTLKFEVLWDLVLFISLPLFWYDLFISIGEPDEPAGPLLFCMLVWNKRNIYLQDKAFRFASGIIYKTRTFV